MHVENQTWKEEVVEEQEEEEEVHYAFQVISRKSPPEALRRYGLDRED